jgi:hypothetical protein
MAAFPGPRHDRLGAVCHSPILEQVLLLAGAEPGGITPVVEHAGLECDMVVAFMQRDDSHQTPDVKSESSAEPDGNDVVLIRGRTQDGKGLSVIRRRDDRLEHGLVMPLENGKPIQGEVVRLRPRREFPLLCDVQVEYSQSSENAQLASDTRAVTKGPGQVATEQYRANWDRIFDRSPSPSGQLN